MDRLSLAQGSCAKDSNDSTSNYLLATAINFTSMSNFDDQYRESGVLDFINNPIGALPDPITFLPR